VPDGVIWRMETKTLSLGQVAFMKTTVGRSDEPKTFATKNMQATDNNGFLDKLSTLVTLCFEHTVSLKRIGH
jgi:hypothetical protein